MKVLMDILPMITPTPGGISNYCQALLKYMPVYLSKEQDQLLPCYNTSKPRYISDELRATALRISYPYRKMRKWVGNSLLYKLPLEWWTGEFDIYHGTSYSFIPTGRAKTVITVHDLVEKHYPDSITNEYRQYLEKWNPIFCRECDHIITVSQATKNDVVKFFSIPEEKVTVIHLAAGAEYCVRSSSSREIADIRTEYQLPERFVLHVGALRARKNVANMLRAFARIHKQVPHHIVLAGAKEEKAEEIFQVIQENGLEDVVHFLGHVKDQHLPLLFNAAEAFFHVSLFEGFGLPLLEAMQSGLAVLASTSSSMPEVVGDAGMLVDPFDIEEMAKAMEQILTDDGERQKMAQRGVERAKLFSWEKMASDTVQVYQKLIQ